MTPRLRTSLTLATALALGACAAGPAPDDPAGALSTDDASADQALIAPGADGHYEGDPLAGPDLDPSADPM